jgi:hypothetical protein
MHAGANMRGLVFIAVVLIAPMAGIAAYAQENSDKVAPQVSEPTKGHAANPANRDYVTSTGATVPRPEDVPQPTGETASTARCVSGATGS